MPLRPLTRHDLLAVAGKMRAADRAEIFATRFDEDPAALIDDLLFGDPIGAIIAQPSGSAVAALGATEMWPGLWSLWMFATDEWPKVAKETTKFARRHLRPALMELGLRRGECKSAAHHHDAHRWLTHLGGRIECRHPAFGKGGEEFITFVIYGEKDVRDTETPPACAGHDHDQHVRPADHGHGGR